MSTISASTTSTTALVATADTTGTLTFQTGAGPTTAMYVDGSQNVGIGTSSPTAKLDVFGSGTIYSYLRNSTVTALTAVDTSSAYFGSGTNSPVVFQINNGEKMRLDTSGNLGIGTSSPAYKLQVVGGAIAASLARSNTAGSVGLTIAPSGTTVQYGFRVDSANNNLNFDSNASGSWATPLILDNAGNLGLGVTPSAWGSAYKAMQLGIATTAQITLAGNDGSIGTNYYLNSSNAVAYASTGAITYLSMYNGQYRFFIAGSGTAGTAATLTQAATLNANGNFLVGGTSDSNSCRFVVTNTNSTRTWGFGTSSSATSFYVLDNTTGSGVYVTAGGSSWTSASDERLKTDLKPIENAIAKVVTLRAVTGRFKTDEEGTSRSFLIAQDVQKVLPEAVDASNPEKLGVSYTDTIPLLVAAIKELKAEFDAYKAAHP